MTQRFEFEDKTGNVFALTAAEVSALHTNNRQLLWPQTHEAVEEFRRAHHVPMGMMDLAKCLADVASRQEWFDKYRELRRRTK